MGERLKLVADTHKQSHMGSKMLFKMLWEDGFFWDSHKEVAKCRPCQVFNVGRCGFQLMSTIVAKQPWDHIAMDLIRLFKCSERGFVFILIIIDVLTPSCEICLLSNLLMCPSLMLIVFVTGKDG